MSYDDQVARICRIANAWEVEVYEKKDAPKSTKDPVPYVDPWKKYAFASAKEVMAFLQERLDKLKPSNSDSEYANGFKEATIKTKK